MDYLRLGIARLASTAAVRAHTPPCYRDAPKGFLCQGSWHLRLDMTVAARGAANLMQMQHSCQRFCQDCLHLLIGYERVEFRGRVRGFCLCRCWRAPKGATRRA